MKAIVIALLLFPLAILAFEPRLVTPYPVVGYREIEFFDDVHKIDRTLLIWYPINATVEGKSSKDPWDVFNIALNASPKISKMPIVILSHGYSGNPHQLSWLTKGLVDHGFIVLGLQHRDLIEGKAHMNHWQRARDVSTMVDQFTKSPLAGWGNLNKIAIAGYSLGGTTALWIAGGRSTQLNALIGRREDSNSEEFFKINEALPTLNKAMMTKDWKDQRVKAAFIMAPSWACLFDEENLRKISIPTYFIAGTADPIVSTKNNAAYFARHIPSSIFQQIPGKVGHYIFISELKAEKRKKADPKSQMNFLFEENVHIDKAWIHSQIVEEACRFFKSQLSP